MCGCSGGHVWLLLGGGACVDAWGACMVALGGCMVAPGGVVCGCSVGGMCGCSRVGMCGCFGGCMVALGGMCGCSQGGHAWDTTRYGDTVNEWAVRILLECILVK